ncbi:MAG: Stk1 family PASTA domain-containing Ser/Thr kinase [Oscillospiraceae bacterium]|nr:Stk1 family PASTA domain-containing Ser/Thr kinase [Oscillospiraceae bacterium]
MDKYIGKKLDGRYEINELIGIGGMAEVYKATDHLEKKEVAVKILKKEFADNDEFVRRFRNESKAIAVLNHPNIVKIFDVGISEKIQYIVMEYIDGITLKELLEQQGALKWKDSVYFITQILRALQHAHDRGIVHRDIKPQNIMLFPDGTIKVMDFGIARFSRESGRTISDKAIGSVHYISPEQARGELTDERSDIYSVGVMMYEMLTGVKPFDGDTPIAIALMHMQESPKSMRSIKEEIPEGLENIVLRAMQRDPYKRYQSASEMIKDIEEFKKNPDITFEYDISLDEPENEGYDEEDEDEEGTRFFKPVKEEEAEHRKKPSPAKKQQHKHRDYDDEEYDEREYENETVSGTSYFIVALTAIAAAVIIMAVVFIAYNLIHTIDTPTQTAPMVDLVGFDYNECKNTYAGYFDITIDEQQYSAEYPSGTIISQSPKPNSTVIVGSTQVKVVVSKGSRMVIVPNVYTLEVNSAVSMIKDAGLQPNIIMQNSDSQENHVISTDPARNEEVEYNSTVKIYVSMGPEQYNIVMPDVVGMDVIDAVNLLESNGFNVKSEKQDSELPQNEVIGQSITALDENGDPRIVDPRQDILITYSSGVAPTTKLNITFAVPEGLSGHAEFRAYVNGNLSGSQTIDEMGYVTTVSIPITGNDVQKVVVEAIGRDGSVNRLGVFNVDFATRSVDTTEFDSELMGILYPGEPEPEETVTEAPEDYGDEITEETTKKKKKKKVTEAVMDEQEMPELPQESEVPVGEQFFEEITQ